MTISECGRQDTRPDIEPPTGLADAAPYGARYRLPLLGLSTGRGRAGQSRPRGRGLGRARAFRNLDEIAIAFAIACGRYFERSARGPRRIRMNKAA